MEASRGKIEFRVVSAACLEGPGLRVPVFLLGPGLWAEPEVSKLKQQGGEPVLVPTQGKLDQTAQETNSVFQHHGRLVGQ